MTFEININGRKVEAENGETLLAASRRAGISIPTLCYAEGMTPNGACRLCVVEIEGRPGLAPSCATPAAAGMKVLTHSPRAVEARRTIVELLLARHPDDCLYCERSGACRLQDLAEELGIRRRRFPAEAPKTRLDISSPAIVRDPAKCILCGKCVRVCEEIQGVGAIDFSGRGSETRIAAAFDQGLNVSSCVYCGQCVRACPTGALSGQSSIDRVMEALNDPEVFVVVQHAPSISITLGEEFGFPPGRDAAGPLTAALRRLNFDRVFDTAFSADLTIMEESAELVRRLESGGPLPMLTSCSPGWIKYVEEFFPKFIPHLSTCKSPQQMLGAVIKTFFAQQAGIDPARIYSVAVMPCTAKKFEAARPEMSRDGMPDIDAVLTTREIARMIRMGGIDLANLEPETADTPFGERTTAGKIFGTSGGVMEAALRNAHYLLTGAPPEKLELTEVRGAGGIREAELEIAGKKLRVAAVSGTGNARRLLEEIEAGLKELDFIEVMTCPGGCVNGGGQPFTADPEAIRKRVRALYRLDRSGKDRVSYQNRSIQRLYREFLGEPLSEKSHQLLHTSYAPREVTR
jgi:iron-only hydrogenase group A